MFESIEDLVETSINLNYKLYPVVTGMLQVLEKSPNSEYQVIGDNLKELVIQLQDFFYKIEASSNEEGDLDLNDFEQRKIH